MRGWNLPSSDEARSSAYEVSEASIKVGFMACYDRKSLSGFGLLHELLDMVSRSNFEQKNAAPLVDASTIFVRAEEAFETILLVKVKINPNIAV